MTGGKGELMEMPRRAGLRVAGDWKTEEVLPPRAVWRSVVAGEARPTVSVRADRADLVAELNAQWHRLGTESGIFGGNGVFLIDVAGNWTGCAPRPWTRVQLTEQWDLAGVLGERPGQPEFVTLSMDGDTLLGATTEEDEVWLIGVRHLRERQETAALAAAQESPQERAAAWTSLFQAPGPSERVREMWAHGLALNSATPDDLRARLLGVSHFLLWRRLPAAVVEAAIVHPDGKVRQLLAEAQPDLTAEQWTRLVLGEREARSRWILTLLAADQRAELTDTAYEQLAADRSVRVREETARLRGLPIRILTALVGDEDPPYAPRPAEEPGLIWTARRGTGS